MQKKLVQSSLALAAATALGLGGAFVAGPAAADSSKTLEVQNEAQMQKALDKYLADEDGKLPEEIGRLGFEGNVLHVGATEETDAVKALEKKYDNVEVQIGPEFESFEAQGKRDLVGGAGYITKAPHGEEGAGGLCSTGFAGWDSSGKQVVITAGHCAEELDKNANSLGEAPLWDMELPSSAKAAGSEQSVLAGVGAPGDWAKTQFGYVSEEPAPPEGSESEAIDIASINVADGFTTKPEVTTWENPSSEDLSLETVPVSKIGNPVRGEAITKSGRTTGVTHGTVAPAEGELDYANISGHLVHGMKVNPDSGMFSDKGDSGGAVYQGDTAVGVISGGNGSFTWVSDLKYSLDQAGIDFQLTKPDDGGDDENANAQADGENANAQVDGEDANAQADGEDANAQADGNDDDADGSDDGDEPTVPEAPKVQDQKVDEGGNITGKAVPNSDVKLSWKPAAGTQKQVAVQAADPEGEVTVKADGEGNFTTEAPSEPGEYAYTATATVDGVTSPATEFTVTVEAADDAAEGDDANSDDDGSSAAEGDDANADNDGSSAAEGAEAGADSDGSKDDDAPAERKLTVDPKEVTASDFVKKDKGVQIKAEGFEEGEKVTLKVTSGPENVEGITLDETANEDGVAGFSIYGTSAADPSAYLGKYDVQVTGANDTADEEALNGSFEVVSDEDGNGGGGNDGDDDGNNGDDDGNGDGGSDLPRTGAELTGLAAGAGLLLVGGAAVVLTLRRNKQN
ncbi:MAG: trypsin-like serine protease [Brevibacterium sp.]